jgi:ABC-type polysaccharide/polyol phosphate export permease
MNGEQVGPVGLLVSLYRQRALVAVLVARDLKARYRGTFLGYLWSLLNPLLLLAVYTAVFTFVIPARVPNSTVPYPLFLFAGLLPWLFGSGALLDAAVVLPDNGPLLKKIVCAPEVFPAVTVLSHLVHHLLALPVLLGATAVVAFLGRAVLPWTVVFLPIALLLWVVAVAGISLGVAALSVHFRDVKDLLHNLLNLFFFATPIIYPLEMVPIGVLRRVIQANPVTPLIEVYRDVVLLGRFPSPLTWAWAAGVAVVCWVVGAWIFSRLRETIAETV